MDLSTLSLIFFNLLTIIFALKEHWNFTNILWIYWWQSIIIGLFNFLKILTLKNFSTQGFFLNGRPVSPTKTSKIYTAFFFTLHYGFFHFGYAMFLLMFSRGFTSASIDINGSVQHININVLNQGLSAGNINYINILIIVAGFFINHLFSFLYNWPQEKKNINLGRLMFFPYARILPMHLTIILAVPLISLGHQQTAILLFLILKSIADIIMHKAEHHLKSPNNPNSFTKAAFFGRTIKF